MITKNFEPSTYQQNILDYIITGKDNLLINAVAGSGKTTTLMLILEALGKDSNNLLCAFNVSIAEVLQSKIDKIGLVNSKAINLHKLGYSLIRDYLSYQKRWNITPNKIYKILNPELEKLNLGNLVFELQKNIHKEIISFCKLCYLNQLTASETDDTYRQIIQFNGLYYIEDYCFSKAIELYRLYLDSTLAGIKKGLVDFDDMVCAPFYLDCVSNNNYDNILVDECQDLNNAQINIIKIYSQGRSRSKKNARLIFVGDDKQAIYGFAGANSDCFSNIPIKLDIKVKKLPLSICYRCGQNIVSYAKYFNPTIEPNPNGHNGLVKTLLNFTELLADIGSNDDITGSILLARKNSQLIKSFFKFFKAKTLFKINKGQNSILDKIQDTLIEYKKTVDFDSLSELLINEKIDLLEKSSKKNTQNQLDFIECLLLLCEQSYSYEEAIDWVNYLVDNGKRGKCLYGSTIHKSKGLEYKTVYLVTEHLPLIHPNQQPWQYEQEINLAYIGCTRAIDNLVLVNTLVD